MTVITCIAKLESKNVGIRQKVGQSRTHLYPIRLFLSHMFGYVEQKLLGRSQKTCFS
jgi:hypothetical protein